MGYVLTRALDIFMLFRHGIINLDDLNGPSEEWIQLILTDVHPTSCINTKGLK